MRLQSVTTARPSRLLMLALGLALAAAQAARAEAPATAKPAAMAETTTAVATPTAAREASDDSTDAPGGGLALLAASLVAAVFLIRKRQR